jgi:GNAT superfamily N-acetyltransferase
MTLAPADRRALEEAAARAWPPHETSALNGWTLRFSGGGSQRANSVLTLHWHGGDLDAAIDSAEAAYRARGLKPIFQIVDVSVPAQLDDRLSARGYASVDRTLLMTKSVARPMASPHVVTRHPIAPPEWLDIYLSVLTPDRRAAAPAILAALPDPKAFFVARREGTAFAVGLAMAEPPWCGVECMATDAAARKAGGARAVMAALETWAAEQGATTLWLQVLEGNAPARALYDSLGFTAVGAYWYRHAPG